MLIIHNRLRFFQVAAGNSFVEEGFRIGIKIFIVVGFSESFLCLSYPFLFFDFLRQVSLINNLNIRFGEPRY